VYFFVTSTVLLVIVCFLFEGMFGGYLILCIFVLIIFIRSFLFVPLLVCLLLKRGKYFGWNQFFLFGAIWKIQENPIH